ncbi:MAG: fibronectin type III domain-containing protein [Clostridia bacterium]|nr:fibronectin type III domain-containing protein [Clostridia bacterium]
MKKVSALLMALVMMLSCFVGFSLNAFAEEKDYVEKEYSYQDAAEKDIENYITSRYELNVNSGTYDSLTGFFVDDVWTYEYLDEDGKTFVPMGAFIKTKQNGMVVGLAKSFVPNALSEYSNTNYTGCAVSGKSLFPGNTTGAAVTYVVPASGTISYDVSVVLPLSSNSAKKNAGSRVTVWVNDKIVYPTSGSMEDATLYAENAPAESPFEISIPSLKVNKGDRVRLCVTSADGKRASKRVDLAVFPLITYKESSLPIGNPRGVPPTNITANKVSNDVSDIKVTWTPATVEGILGYNFYVKNDKTGETQKMNDAPVTGTEYTMQGLPFDLIGRLTVTTVTAAGESDPSKEVGFRTPYREGAGEVVIPSDTSTDSDEGNQTSDVVDTNQDQNSNQNDNNNQNNNQNNQNNQNTNNQNNNNQNNNTNKDEFPWWILIVVASVVIVVCAVLLVLMLKKPAEAVAEESVAAPVEEAPAASEEAATEQTASEEPKDEE